MYIDFIDTLRNIQNGIYPQVQQWRAEVEVLRDETIVLKNETEAIKDETVDISGHALASEKNAKSWAEEEEWHDVIKYTWNEDSNLIESSPLQPVQYSSMHWAKQSKHLAEVQKWEAEAAQMTACSFSNEAINTPVKVYTSNGDGTFTANELEYVFSALHYRQDTEQLTGHKRWIETQTATNGQAIFGFQKNINHADVYVNGVRQIEGSCYSRVLKDLHFNNPLREGDTVTISGMEAITGDEFQTILEENKQVYKDTQKLMWEAEASERTAQSFVSEPVDQFVKIFTSNDDGTFTVTTTTWYSALHWSVKMNMTLSYLVIVDTYHDLELLNVNDAKLVYVRGGYALNDGRNGLFHYDSSQSGINNGGTIINGWVREYDGPMNIMWFDIAADGVTNDTDAINAALQWNTHILIPEKTYLIDDTITFNNKLIVTENAKFITIQHTGVAVDIIGTREHHGITGNLTVEWTDNDMDVEKISFQISDSIDAFYELSSIGATTGIYLNPEFGNVFYNDFRLNYMENNTVGIFVRKETNGQRVEFFRFRAGNFVQNKKVYSQYINFANASHIYIEDDTCFNGILFGQKLTITNNVNDEYLLFRINGSEIVTTPFSVSNDNGQDIKASISGINNVFDGTYVPSFNAYNREEPGYISQIDTSSADGFTMLGTSSHIENDENVTFEYTSNGTKSLMTLENTNGISTYYPVSDENHEIVHSKVEGGTVETISSAYRTMRYNAFTLNKSVISNDKITLDDTVDFNYADRFEVNIHDANDRNRSTKLETVIADSTDTQSIIINKTSLTINENPNTAQLVKDDLRIDDEIDFSHLSQKELKINDAVDSLAANKKRISITDGTVDYYVDKDNAKFTDGAMTNERTAEYSEIINGTDTNKAIATDIDITSGQYHTNLSNSQIEITDDTDTLHGDRYILDLTDGIDTNHMTKTSSEISDATDSNLQTKTDITVTDGTNTLHESKTVVEIFDATDKNENDKLHQKIFDSTNSNENTKLFSEIKDNVDSNKSTKLDITITDGIDTLHENKTNVDIYDGTDGNRSDKLKTEIKDGTDSFTATKHQVTITDSTDTTTVNKTNVHIADTTQSFDVNKDKLQFINGVEQSSQDAQDYIVTDGTDTAHLSKIELKIEDSDESLTATKNSLSIVNTTNGKSIDMNTESIIFVEGNKQNTVSAEGSITEDTSTGAKNTRTDAENILESGSDKNTISSTGSIVINGTDTGTYNADTFGINDGTNSNVNTKNGSTIQDGSANQITSSAVQIKITSGTDDTTITASTNTISGSIGSNVSKQDSIELVAGANTHTIKAENDAITNGSDTNTRTPLSDVLTDGTKSVSTTSSSIVVSNGITAISTIDSDKVEVKDGADISKVEKDGITVTDGTNTAELLADGIRIQDGTNVTNIVITGSSELTRDDASNEVLKIKNSASGGKALKLDVASGSDSALEIEEAGTLRTKITADENWIIADKKVIWAINSAPNSGVWTSGDIAYNSTPIAGGKIGWIFVSKADETGDITTGSPDITNVTNTTAFAVGDNISGPGIPADSFVTVIDTVAGTLTINQNATATTTGITLTTTGWKPFGAIDA